MSLKEQTLLAQEKINKKESESKNLVDDGFFCAPYYLRILKQNITLDSILWNKDQSSNINRLAAKTSLAALINIKLVD